MVLNDCNCYLFHRMLLESMNSSGEDSDVPLTSRLVLDTVQLECQSLPRLLPSIKLLVDGVCIGFLARCGEAVSRVVLWRTYQNSTPLQASLQLLGRHCICPASHPLLVHASNEQIQCKCRSLLGCLQHYNTSFQTCPFTLLQCEDTFNEKLSRFAVLSSWMRWFYSSHEQMTGFRVRLPGPESSHTQSTIE